MSPIAVHFACLCLCVSNRARVSRACVGVQVLCDSGIKYLSKVYSADWLRGHGMNDVDDHSAIAALTSTKE